MNVYCRIEGDLEFRGYGCYCYDKKGKKLKYPEFKSYDNMEDMINQAYSNEKVVLIKVFRCYGAFKELDMQGEPLENK